MYKDAPLHIWIRVLTPNPARGAVAEPIVITLSPELKGLAAPIRALVSKAEALVRSGRGGHAVDYGAIEREIEQLSADIERSAHADILASLEVDAPRVCIGGKRYALVGHSPATYYLMAGPVTLTRALYREVGVRNGKTVDAISLRAGVIGDGWLPKTAQSMAFLVQQGTSREAAAASAQLGRLPYSRTSFERVTHEVGGLWGPVHVDIEDQLITEFKVPEKACSISIAIDRVAVPMEEPAKPPLGRPRTAAPKNPITRAFRMAYCGAVTLHDRMGRCLHTIRYGCMPAGDATLLCTGMANDVYRLMQRKPSLLIVLLADGAPEMWNLLEAALPPELLGKLAKLVDFWHVIEKLAAAVKLLAGDEAGRAALLRRWKLLLRRRNGAALEILAELRASGKEWLRIDSAQPVHDAITYLERHHERMAYASARRQHLPIGSGNVEATCKTLIAVRMKRAGSRWKHVTGDHIVKLRALALSDRWDSAMKHLHAKRRTAVRKAA